MSVHPHLDPLPSRERKSSKGISERKLYERVVGGGMHPHPSMNSGQALNPLPSRERKSSKGISEKKLRERCGRRDTPSSFDELRTGS
jgi:hypothetical protein